MRHELRCAICGDTANGEEARHRRTTIELFGINVDGWIEQGNCPAPWCLSSTPEYKPATVKRRWLKHLKQEEKP